LTPDRRGTDVRRNTILELKAEQFNEDWCSACDALAEAYKRMTDPKHYAVVDVRKWAPASSMLVTLAALLDHMKRKKGAHASNYKKLDEWYWATVFANRYNEGVNTNTLSDYQRMVEWFNDETKVPDFIRKFNVASVDLHVESQSSAIYRGVISLVVRAGAKDFKTGKEPALEPSKVQDDHVFPRKIFKTDVVLNRTLISTNQEKSDAVPSEYFKALVTINTKDGLLDVLRTHLIDVSGLDALLANDLTKFLDAREKRIREVIGELVPHRISPSAPDDENIQ